MELRHLEYFVAVAQELSFTRASRRLHVVQSGVSSAIQSLERELGVPLFDRNRHRVSLTDAGQALLPEARATLAAAQAAREAVSEARGGLRGTVTVGTTLAVGPLDLPELLGRFHATHPGVTVRLRLASIARSRSRSPPSPMRRAWSGTDSGWRSCRPRPRRPGPTWPPSRSPAACRPPRARSWPSFGARGQVTQGKFITGTDDGSQKLVSPIGHKVPYAESIGALKELLDEGKIRMAGISNASIKRRGRGPPFPDGPPPRPDPPSPALAGFSRSGRRSPECLSSR